MIRLSLVPPYAMGGALQRQKKKKIKKKKLKKNKKTKSNVSEIYKTIRTNVKFLSIMIESVRGIK